MALVVVLKSVENLDGVERDRQVTLSFREKSFSSNVVPNAKRVAYFGQTFEWPIARPVDPSETLDLNVYNFSKYFSNRLIGSYRLLLQQLSIKPSLQISDSLVGENNKLLEEIINFDVKYESPSGHISDFADGFNQSISGVSNHSNSSRSSNGSGTDQHPPDEDDDDDDDGRMISVDVISSEVDANYTSSAIARRKSVGVSSEAQKFTDFQVMVTIIEGQQLAGLDIDPVIKVEVGSESRYTSIRQSTNCPYYNEYFVFGFHDLPSVTCDKLITITAYHAINIPGRQLFKEAGNLIAAKNLIGTFRCDVGTVYATPGHQFYHKWATLMDPRDFQSGPKGYIKCDISVSVSGQPVKPPTGIKDSDTDNIDGNLLLPVGMTKTRQRARYSVTVYRAEDLPRGDSGFLATVQRTFFTAKDSTAAFIDAFVRISFAGHIGRTSVQKSYDPEWNEVLRFVDLFPPLCQRVKIEICDANAAGNGHRIIATHFIQLSQIMELQSADRKEVLPTFGPSWINLYGSLSSGGDVFGGGGMSGERSVAELNEGVVEGVAFRGRILLSINTNIIVDKMEIVDTENAQLEKLSGRTVDEERWPMKDFLLFASIFEASLIDCDFKGKPISFEVSIGRFGDSSYDTRTKRDSDEDLDDDEDDVDVKKRKLDEDFLPSRSATAPRTMKMMERQWGYLVIDDEKPCMFTVAKFEDMTKRLVHSNLISRMADHLALSLRDVSRHLKSKAWSAAFERFVEAVNQLAADSDAYLHLLPSVSVGCSQTKLDRRHRTICHSYVEQLTEIVIPGIRQRATSDALYAEYLQAIQIEKQLRHLSKDPQHSLPDVFLWMVVDGRRVAYHRFQSRDLLYSPDRRLKGSKCSVRQSLFLKRPGRRGQGKSGWMIPVAVEVYLWLGEYDGKTKRRYLEHLPPGFEVLTDEDDDGDDEEDEEEEGVKQPPIALIYSEGYRLQVRAFLFQARSLLASDLSGLSDPFACVIFNNHCATTQVVEETLCPVWNESLVIDDVIVYGLPQPLTVSPPPVIVELYDYDRIGQPEFIGRLSATPSVVTDYSSYSPVHLSWHKINRGLTNAGEILAAFELIQSDVAILLDLPPVRELAIDEETRPIFAVPDAIRPSMNLYRLEILFRGVRDLRRVHLLSIDRPQIAIEVSGRILSSVAIDNVDENSNFDKQVDFLELDLPDNVIFWPPLMIRCFSSTAFGTSSLVGCSSIDHIQQYLHTPLPTSSPSCTVSSSSSSSPSSSPSKPPRHSVLVSCASPSSPVESTIIRAAGVPSIEDQNPVTNPFRLPLTVGPDSNHGTAAAEAATPFADNNDTEAGREKAATLNGQPSSKEEASRSKHDVLRKSETKEKSGWITRKKKKKKDRNTKTHRQLIEDLDWWSKYYISRKEFIRGTNEYESPPEDNSDDLFDKIDEPDFGLKTLDYTQVDFSGLGEIEEASSVDANLSQPKLRPHEIKPMTWDGFRKRVTNLFYDIIDRLRAFKACIVDALRQRNSWEMMQQGTTDGQNSADQSHVARIQFYPCELERVPELTDGFKRWFDTFRLYRGKKGSDEFDDDRNRYSGVFKGKFCLYKISDEEDVTNESQKTKKRKKKPVKEEEEVVEPEAPPSEEIHLRLSRGLPSHQPIEVRVIVYVIRGVDLHPVDLNGKADPYLVIRCGRKKVVDKKNRINKQLNPVFGRSFEFDVVFPMDSLLNVEIWDYDALSSDDLIGETTIDLEDRFFSPNLARCALQQRYEIYGYNTWRNPLRPSQILQNLCSDVGYPPPQYLSNSISLEGHTFHADSADELLLENEAGDTRPTKEHLALKLLRNWQMFPRGCHLVPEHIETRALHSAAKPGVTQGRVEMWVDMFPADCSLPSNATVDVTPRQPKSYELRCIVWNTDDVTLDDINVLTGELSSDIFVRGYFLGKGEDEQQTDTHYRSLTGDGNFNWRFIFRFDYLKAEDKVVLKRKDFFLGLGDTEDKFPPNLTVQIWDADVVSADDFLGSLTLNLNRIPKPAKSPRRCNLEMIDQKTQRPTLNLFKNRRCKGWWPIVARETDDSQDIIIAADEDGGGGRGGLVLKGKVELELHLLTAEEADKSPAGFGRQEPDSLPDPNRPDTSFVWLMNPLKSLKYVIWHNYRWKIVRLLLLLIVVAFVVIFFYNIPGALVTKMFFIG